MATKQHHRAGRRDSSISRLEDQLKTGTKVLSTKTAKRYEGKKQGDSVPLESEDVKKIKFIIDRTKKNMQ